MKRKLFTIFCRLMGISFLAVALVFSVTSAGHSGEVRGVTDDTIKIGLIADMTGPTATDISRPILTGLKTQFRYINDKGGIHGRKINLLIEDDRYVIPHAVAAFKKLVFKDEILALQGPLSSSSAFALLGQIHKRGIPTISYSPSDRMILPIQKYVFTCNGQYEDDIHVVFQYLFKEIKESHIALVYPDMEVGLAALRAAEEETKRRDVKLHKEILNIGALDATTQVLNLQRAKVRHVIIQAPAFTAVILLRSAVKLGFHARYYGTTVTTTEDIIETGGTAAKDYIGASQYTSWYDNCPGAEKVRKAMMKYYNKIPMKSRGLCMGWVGGMVLTEGLTNAGRDLTPERLRDALEGMKNLDTGGLTGPISYSPNDHKGLDCARIFKPDLDKKVFVAITDWMRGAK
ncbi:MAG: ABC transporter substrate-binding protein [Thermodesulfobacteriota bacterium]|nr:ABC transporter substrate-binding protein [Thermodesulfobacteriota bacterium]